MGSGAPLGDFFGSVPKGRCCRRFDRLPSVHVVIERGYIVFSMVTIPWGGGLHRGLFLLEEIIEERNTFLVEGKRPMVKQCLIGDLPNKMGHLS